MSLLRRQLPTPLLHRTATLTHRTREAVSTTMSPPDQPDLPSDACSTPGRRRARPALRPSPGRARDACPEQPHRPIGRGDDHARPTCDPHTELEGFAHWFADWWLRRGRELTDTTGPGGRGE